MGRATSNPNPTVEEKGGGRTRRERLLLVCAWAVHLYTALGAIAGLLTVYFTAQDDFRAAFLVMAAAVFIDSSDGPMARAVRIRQRIPVIDGALLDNIVDYVNYVLAPAFLMLRARLLPPGVGGLALASFVMLASAYGFCRVDAKTDDHYFLGFPSYWNLVAFYLFYLALPVLANQIIVAVFAVMVFVPIKYIYPNRTRSLRALTIAFGVIWAAVTIAMIPMLPKHHPVMLYVSLAFIAYYLITSFVLHVRSSIMGARPVS
ncbi:MAG: CDP-alcohol phosphatidyltransferase family protein [Candidatus Binataceae bacterium]